MRLPADWVPGVVALALLLTAIWLANIGDPDAQVGR